MGNDLHSNHDDLVPGLYEQIVNDWMARRLGNIPEERQALEYLDNEEAAQYLTQYLTGIIRKALGTMTDKTNGQESQLSLTNNIISLIAKQTNDIGLNDLQVSSQNAQLLLALLKEHDPSLVLNKKAKDYIRPESSVAQSSLFTGASHEPQMASELKKEIMSADGVDMLVSFIKWSGLQRIINELTDFTKSGGQLRVVTTSYMGATDLKAIDKLAELPNTSIRISYDTARTRLHAKAYMFHRNTGFSTAYVGSSNLSNPAISSGLEWNLKVTQQELPITIDKINATFESYWQSTEFEDYTPQNDPSQRERLAIALQREGNHKISEDNCYIMEIRPYPYQQEILDQLKAERDVRGRFKNLVVAATGTGKTVISALDYKRYIKDEPHRPHRLLFVAHRKEILKQSLYTYRAILRDQNFGDLCVGEYEARQTEHVFISIQTLNSKKWIDKLDCDYYDYIVIDEFHHAAADSYQALLHYFKPRILLGLTATPERLDRKSILSYFDGCIAAEIRLPEAINRKLLCPFEYFGVTDPVSLAHCTWKSGKYDTSELTERYVTNKSEAEKRARIILESLLKYTADINRVIALGFCVNVAHAKFMSRFFNDHGIPAMWLSGESHPDIRNAAQKDLLEGKVRIIFVVDLYNEGVDIPEINTVLFLRPTESLTIFIQQLGRGLRLANNKEILTVLDFIGQANKNYSFERKFSAILAESHRSLRQEVQTGFLSVPTGCFIQLERQAMDYVLDNISTATGSRNYLLYLVRSFVDEYGRGELTLNNFCERYQISPKHIYKKTTFSELCAQAGVTTFVDEPHSDFVPVKALGRLSSANSRRWISFLLDWLASPLQWNHNHLSTEEVQMVQMFYATIWMEGIKDWDNPVVINRFNELAHSPILLTEIRQLLTYCLGHIDFVDEPVHLGFPCPLDLHCSYSRDQILVALGHMNPSSMREGVKYLPQLKVDLLFVTLNKAEKDYSPSTLYEDYSISDKLFHWQSQSNTAESSSTGQRYINHEKEGSKVLLFVREFKKDPITKDTPNYTYLGLVRYVKHTGSSPMNITWELDRPIPARFMKMTEKLMIG